MFNDMVKVSMWTTIHVDDDRDAQGSTVSLGIHVISSVDDLLKMKIHCHIPKLEAFSLDASCDAIVHHGMSYVAINRVILISPCLMHALKWLLLLRCLHCVLCIRTYSRNLMMNIVI